MQKLACPDSVSRDELVVVPDNDSQPSTLNPQLSTLVSQLPTDRSHEIKQMRMHSQRAIINSGIDGRPSGSPDGIDLRQMIREGESEVVEFKTAKSALPQSLFETVCAMLNGSGGSILLGVADNGEVIGVSEDVADSLCKDFANLSNNPQKIEPSFLIHPHAIAFEGKVIIHAFIPPSSQVHRTGGRVYERSRDGDYEVRSSEQIKNIYLRKSGFYTESTLFPYLFEEHFVPDLVAKTREIIKIRSPKHPWNDLSLKEFYRVAGLYRTDISKGVEGFTQAALLLFGKEEIIQSALPHYKTDALLRRKDTERYDDRENIRCNLVLAYDLLMNFIAKHLPDKFYLEDSVRLSLRDTIFREIVVNLLIHREYSNATPATLIIYADRVETQNANRPHVHGNLRPGSFVPFPKNPVIAKFFAQMGRAEELGTGVAKVYKYMKAYSGSDAVTFFEGDLFRTALPLSSPSSHSDRVDDGAHDGAHDGARMARGWRDHAKQRTALSQGAATVPNRDR